MVSQLETSIKGMLAKETLLDLIRYFIVFEKSKTVGASLCGCPEKLIGLGDKLVFTEIPTTLRLTTRQG